MLDFKTKILIKYCIIILTFTIPFLIIVIFNKLDQILYYPLITPIEWCEIQPCIELTIFSYNITIVQISSTLLVYSLGILSIWIGIYIFRDSQEEFSKKWWGVALVLWGIGSLLAGTSYQIFSYEIKCAGYLYCRWTSLWEISYLFFSVGSVNAMMMAQAHACAIYRTRKLMKAYSCLNFCIYFCIILIGSILPNRFMISFELMVLFLFPTILILFIINGTNYIKNRNKMDLIFLIIWISLGIIIGNYFLYFAAGVTDILWENGIWFSENDILHIGLILWMIYIGMMLPKYIKDL